MSKPARLCAHDLPSGKPCRQVALKGEPGCRHHMRLFRHVEAELMHEQAMARLEAKLNALDLTDLLRALHFKLGRLQSAVRPDPEARLTLSVAIEHLRKCNEVQQAFQKFARQTPTPAFNSPEFNNLFEKFMESTN